ncbi:hypothetical protein OG735_19560 [Streptomyces sp. NBC_01210]|uniref:hypothetical protein n=1 Tax=Streptomyces sp. NBC_01210 TaxID=2903774 RepID=UPI002E13C109|nr:hypothetical protein OG735_19560 [Streptomyces sp. NBC_01210]
MGDVKIVVERRYAPDPIDYQRLVSLVESTGERVVLTEADVPVSVLFPAGVVAELEHWARADYSTRAPISQGRKSRTRTSRRGTLAGSRSSRWPARRSTDPTSGTCAPTAGA